MHSASHFVVAVAAAALVLLASQFECTSGTADLTRNRIKRKATVDPAEALALRQDVEVLRELGVEMRPRGPWLRVSAIEGESASIPCNLTWPMGQDGDRQPEAEADGVKLVLWFKDNSTRPIYSFDNRGRSPQHWSNASVLAARASFRIAPRATEPGPPEGAFRLAATALSDGGLYRCRVDYRRAKTTTSEVELRVIVLPKKPRIYMEVPKTTQRRSRWRRQRRQHGQQGRHRRQRHQHHDKHDFVEVSDGDAVGPFEEGSAARLRCVVRGGQPRPNVTWRSHHGDEDNGTLLDGTFSHTEGGATKNHLELRPLRREDLGRKLTCVADNTGGREAREASVRIDMILQPVAAKVEVMDQPGSAGPYSGSGPDEGRPGLPAITRLSSGRVYRVRCRVWGARPNNPNVTWWLRGKLLDISRSSILNEDSSSSDNETVSVIELHPGAEDDGADLACRAAHTRPRSSPAASHASDVVRISILYTPRLKLSLGRTLNASNLKENDDVYFECAVDARPAPKEIEWRHNGVVLSPDAGRGVIVSNRSLVLQRVGRFRAGGYRCAARNSEGHAESNAVDLRIKYKPFCVPTQRKVYGATLGEPMAISCEVAAEPSEGVSFEWRVNSTTTTSNSNRRSTALTGRVMRRKGNIAVSVAEFSPKSERDLGTVSCVATNAVGRMEDERSCVFHVILARRPTPPANCSVIEDPEEGRPRMGLRCHPGFGGGLDQNFTLEVRHAHSHKLLMTLSNDTAPSFSVTSGLSPSTGYIVSAFSSNSKGRSDRLNFHVFTGESKRGGVSGGGISVDRSGSKADKADKLLAETSESALTKSALSPSSAVAGSSKKSPEHFSGNVIYGIAFVVSCAFASVFLAIASFVCVRRLQQTWTLRGDDHRRRSQPKDGGVAASFTEAVEVVDGEREIASMIHDNGDRGLESFKGSDSPRGIDSPKGVDSPGGPDSIQVRQFSTFQRSDQKNALKQVPKVIVEDGFERYERNHEDPGHKVHIVQQLSSRDRESRV